MRRFFSPLRTLAVCLAGCASGAAAPASADPIKIAVFDFELDDFSAGAGLGDAAADGRFLSEVTSEARELLRRSGRYVLVDTSTAQDVAARDRWLRQCHGCEAAIARSLGADQSFVGVVTRISRTDYVIRFQILDARSGAVALARTSDLRVGADYSWRRGAAALIKKSLLEEP